MNQVASNRDLLSPGANARGAATFLSLFSGIGGLDLGLERAGWKCVAQVECDPFCRRVLAKHWPDVPKFEDVRTFNGCDLQEAPTLIAGGFPCQDISNQGLRAGIDGEKSGLWKEYRRLICEIRPRFVLVENVAALLVRGLDTVLGDLAALGFDAEWSVFSACAFGAPHPRERLFVIAYPTDDARLHESDSWKSSERLSDNANSWRADPWDASRPRICGMDDGIPDRVDRTARLGNAVVPQVGEWLGARLMEAWKAGEA